MSKYQPISSNLKVFEVSNEWFLPSLKEQIIRFLPNDKKNPLSGDFAVRLKRHWIGRLVDCTNNNDCNLCKKGTNFKIIYRCNILKMDSNEVMIWDMSERTYKNITNIYLQLEKNPTCLIENLPFSILKNPKGLVTALPSGDSFTPISDTDAGIDGIISKLHNLTDTKKV